MRLRSVLIWVIAALAIGSPGSMAQTKIIAGQVTSLGYCQLTSVSAATPISTCPIPSNATFVNVIIEGQTVRYRTDGVNPTASVGMLLDIGADKVFSVTALKNIKFIETAPTATVDLEFYR